MKLITFTVTQLTTYIKSLFEGDTALSEAFLEGEISNFTRHYKSGHLYFSLKDEHASIKAIMFAGSAQRLRFVPRDGMKVLVRGRVSVYEATGQYQFYAEDMQPAGLGALSLAYEQLKEKLAAEGLFSAERKRRLPLMPKKIGVITSKSGAVLHDILTVLERRFPMAEVLFCAAPVQGEGAAEALAQAICLLNAQAQADVIIIGRGGGSMEDLWAFNEEILARTVAASQIPVVSAVGHETDFTICDFVADFRAPTPSAAAEICVPDYVEVMALISGLYNRIEQAAGNRLSAARVKLQEVKNRNVNSLERRIIAEKSALAAVAGKLNALSPLGVLSRGYSIAEDSGGHVLTDCEKVRIGEKISVRLNRGALECTVDGKAGDLFGSKES